MNKQKNGIILYQSKYGATKEYAKWLSETTGFNFLEIKKAKIDDILQYDLIILGGGLYATGISGISFLKKNYRLLKQKQILVFAVGASPYVEGIEKVIAENNLTGELSDIPLFYCRGKWDLDNMSFIDKNLCKLLQNRVSKKDPSSYEIWEKALIEAGNKTHDWTDKVYLNPILDRIE